MPDTDPVALVLSPGLPPSSPPQHRRPRNSDLSRILRSPARQSVQLMSGILFLILTFNNSIIKCTHKLRNRINLKLKINRPRQIHRLEKSPKIIKNKKQQKKTKKSLKNEKVKIKLKKVN